MSIGSWLKKKGDAYRAGEPERREKRLSKLGHQLEVTKVKEEISESQFKVRSRKLSLGERRQKLSAARQKSMPSMSSPFGQSVFGKLPASVPTSPVPKRSGKKKKSSKRKRR